MIGAHAAAGMALLFLMPDFLGAALALAVAALGLAAAWSRALLRGRDAVRALELSGDAVVVELGDGRVVAARAARRRYVSRLLVTLRLRAPAFRGVGDRALLVTADMLDPGEFRRLRVWALWGRLPAVAGEQLAA
jgi:hypothetical protein